MEISAAHVPQGLTLANTSDLARRRRTVLVRAALTRLPAGDHQRLTAYRTGTHTPLPTVINLIDASGAAAHCTTLITRLHAQSRENISSDPELPPAVRASLTTTWDYMRSLYDTASPISRLYLAARPDLNAAA
ncbi:hypothetical protein [Streptomyces niveus]|uniref:hypothetical protein n=1 Tax=Streptomyces niveus TaxID=193462 RepID=UPI00114CD03E|nr:hypothetical protein [Streptomyces niveus]